MWFVFILIGMFLWIVIPDEITQPVGDAIKDGLKKAASYLKKGPKEPYDE